MHIKKYRWSRAYESAEEELVELLAAQNVAADRVVLEDRDLLAETYEQNTKIWCVEGSIIFTIKDQAITLQAGDALDVPSSESFQAIAGFTGCTYYLAHL